MNSTTEQLLKEAVDSHNEVDIMLDGGTAFPQLIADGRVGDAYTFIDREGSTISLDEGIIKGAVVATTPPAWYLRQQHQQLGQAEQHATA